MAGVYDQGPYIWDAYKTGKTKVYVTFRNPNFSCEIGISRLVKNVILQDAYSSDGDLIIDYRHPHNDQVQTETFFAEDVLKMIKKHYPKRIK